MAPKQFPLKGYTLPLTHRGQSSIVEPPPWYYGGEVMQLVFRTDAKRAKKLIPPPLEMGPEPGKGIVWFVEWGFGKRIKSRTGVFDSVLAYFPIRLRWLNRHLSYQKATDRR